MQPRRLGMLFNFATKRVRQHSNMLLFLRDPVKLLNLALENFLETEIHKIASSSYGKASW
jgi:hypothetical protein